MTWTRVARVIGFLLAAGIVGFPAAAGDYRVEKKLLPSEPRASGGFGIGAALDGETAAVAAYDNTGPAVFVFERGDGTWGETQKLTSDEVGSTFGFQVAIDGDTLAATATTEEIEGARTGAVYVFVRGGDGVWTRQAKLEPSDPHTGARFGYSVDLEGDTLVVGDTWHDDTYDKQGVVYVYTRSGTIWTEQDRLTADNAAKGDFFGSGVAVSGDTILVGARANDDPYNGAGSAYVFARSGDTWTQQNPMLWDPGGWLEEQFGARVAMAGDWAMIAVPYDSNTFTTEGSVRVYKRNGASVSYKDVLRSPDPRPAGNFGLALALTEDRMVIAEEGYDGLGIYTGRAHVFVRDGDSWVFDETLNAPDAAEWDVFGGEVGITDEVVLVTAPNADDPEINSGNAWIFDDTPPVARSSAALIPTSVRVVLPNPGKRRMPPGLRAVGLLDTGPDEVDLTQACDLRVGSAVYPITQMTVSRNGRTFTHEDDVVTFKVTTPRNECSRATFTLNIRDDLTGHVDPNGTVTLGFDNVDVDTAVEIPLSGGRFRLSSTPDALGESVLHCIRARAQLRGPERDSFAVTLRFGSDGVPPAEAPAVVVGFGDDFEEELDPANFRLRRKKWIYTDRKAKGVTRAVLDFRTGRATIAAKRCSLGAFDQGPNPLEIMVGIDDDLRAVALRAAVRRRTLRY